MVQFVPTVPSTTAPIGEPVTSVLGSKTIADLSGLRDAIG